MHTSNRLGKTDSRNRLHPPGDSGEGGVERGGEGGGPGEDGDVKNKVLKCYFRYCTSNSTQV